MAAAEISTPCLSPFCLVFLAVGTRDDFEVKSLALENGVANLTACMLSTLWDDLGIKNDDSLGLVVKASEISTPACWPP
jgi:hypothetical protein